VLATNPFKRAAGRVVFGIKQALERRIWRVPKVVVGGGIFWLIKARFHFPQLVARKI